VKFGVRQLVDGVLVANCFRHSQRDAFGTKLKNTKKAQKILIQTFF